MIYLMYSIIGIGSNIYSLYRNGSVFLVGLSLLSGVILIVSVEKFHRSFDYPLFFVRDELNYWGGAFGGVTAGLFYIIGFLSFESIGFPSILSYTYVIISGFTSLLVLYTGTVLRDMELGYIEDPSS